MFDAVAITNGSLNANEIPSQDICDSCKRQEWWHDDEKLKTKTCQRFTTRNARSAGLNRARR